MRGQTVILVDYGKGVLCSEVIAAALEGARSAGAPVIVDPNGVNYNRYAGATVLTPNVKEAELASQRPILDQSSLAGRRAAAGATNRCVSGNDPGS